MSAHRPRFIVVATSAEHKPFGIFDRDRQRTVASYVDPSDVRDALATFYGWTPSQARALDFDAIDYSAESVVNDDAMMAQHLADNPAELAESSQVAALRAGVIALDHRAATARAIGLTDKAHKYVTQANELGRMADKLASIEAQPITGGAPSDAELAAHAARETIHNYTNPQLHPVTDAEATAVVEWCREWAADCEWADVSSDDCRMMNAAALLRTCERFIDGGLAFVLADVRRVAATDAKIGRCPHGALTAFCTHEDCYRGSSVASRIAKDAAEAFQYDDDAEDAQSAAQRAADILRDLSPEDMPAFMLRIFGIPVADRYQSQDVLYHRQRAATEQGYAFPDSWQERVNLARIEKGELEVASALVTDHADTIAHVLFMGDAFGSTNQAQWDEGQRAIAALNTLRAFTYDSGPLDYVASSRNIEDMERDAVLHCIEAVQYAADNARHGDSE